MSKDKSLGEKVGEKVVVSVLAGAALTFLGLVVGGPPGAVLGLKVGTALGLGHDGDGGGGDTSA